MKNTNLFFGILALLAGIAALTAAFIFQGNMIGICFGIGGAGCALGIGNIISYFYWSSEKNKKRYEEILETKSIEINDELNSRIGDKAGKITGSIVFAAVCAIAILLEILEGLGLVTGSYLTVTVLCGLLVFQIIIYMVVFSAIRKKF
ncbi:MAG: hypothetical protein IKR27_09900 [Lachnospiraceae bacterium]|nr:hypothetical protein [Lachnospiraceae bacterium]